VLLRFDPQFVHPDVVPPLSEALAFGVKTIHVDNTRLAMIRTVAAKNVLFIAINES